MHCVIVMSLKVWQQVSSFESIVTSVAAGYIILLKLHYSLTASVVITCLIV